MDESDIGSTRLKMKMKNIKCKIAVWMLLCLVFVRYSSLYSVSAGITMTDIRVGLTTFYSNKTKITMKNNVLLFGYCIEDHFKAETEIRSSTGFSFTPAYGYYISLNKTFSSFQDAKGAAGKIEKLGVKAYPVSIYRGYYRVYVGGEQNKTMTQTTLLKINGRYGFYYSTVFLANKQLLLVSGSEGQFIIDGYKMKAYPQFKAGSNNSFGIAEINLGTRSYRGRIEIGRYGKNTLTAVNIINVEAYLLGVVPAEMSSKWPKEALKAQAVCARSFALMKTGYSADSDIANGYYLNDTVNHQVYRGYLAENPTTNQAVRETMNEVVSYQGKIITAFYYSTSGGKTESGNDVWGLKQSYYKSVPDPYETEPERAPWVVSYDMTKLQQVLLQSGDAVGTIQSISTQIVTGSNRVYSLKISGSLGSTTLQSQAVRTTLGLSSTKFTVIQYGDNPDQVFVRSKVGISKLDIADSYILSAQSTIEKADQNAQQYIVRGAENMMNYPKKAPPTKDTVFFAGMGFGHGVGMSQSGAKGMANAGYSYEEIISYYFSGCKVINSNKL